MSEFSNESRQRKLVKPLIEGTAHRTITIEDRTANDGFTFHIKIENSTVPENSGGFGLQDPTKRTPAIQVSTPQILRVNTVEEAIEFAEKELQRSVEHEHFTALPAGEDFPVF